MSDPTKKDKKARMQKAKPAGKEKAKNTGAATEKGKALAREKKPKSWLEDAKDVSLRLAPVVVTPALQYYLKAFHLVPLAAWGLDADAVATLSIVTYVIATASAAAASFFGAPSNKVKGWILIIAGLILIASYSTYAFGISQHPPGRVTHLFYYPAAFVSFYVTYISYGVVVAYVSKFLTKK